jgi:KTSC domain-containing protein
MLLTAVESSVLATVAYDQADQQLWLVFRSHAVYCYFGVPPSLCQGILAAASKGNYFNRYIRGRFPFQRLAPPRTLHPNSVQTR